MRRARGFTLVELMVTLVVIGLAGAAVALTLPTGDDMLRKDADRFAARLGHARDEAILGMRAVEVAVTARGYGFSRRRFEGWQPIDGRAFAAVDWTRGTRPQLARRDAPLAIRFDPTGAATPAALVLLRDGERVRVSVDGGGVVKVDGQHR
ncbi:GspH/FimT family pseudopilin [Luteimonas sp. MC1750]|uniref:GspH/FimT family pseudopilin n=1 Tax=Luteimonas sp. MC1750 TaxID=2799326 RepID=UPI0018F0D9BE|nr:GspH/FimT family pseudopilin [Luteimonas sp. MC1750]MBJ6983907.1 GspH/FimT family pseudopilin [Luteimonas sp. MC1750]QQO07211.1 GspH/FimT family pseudopilin [Luteimonas sp. MC1750]